MLPELPSLHFQPRFYTGTLGRFHLPVLYDLVALRQPRRVVVLGFSDGEVPLTLCQAAMEHEIDCRVLAVRRDAAGENADADEAWQKAIGHARDFYPKISTLLSGSPTDMAEREEDGSIEILLFDDCDSAAVLRGELQAWQPKLAADAVILFHGIGVDREDSVRSAWREVNGGGPTAEWQQGVGLVMTSLAAAAAISASPVHQLFALSGSTALDAIHALIAERIDLQARTAQAEREKQMLRLRQVWLDSITADRWKAQEIMDDQARQLTALRDRFEALQNDRDDAQQVMAAQARDLTKLNERTRQLAQLQEHFEALKKDRDEAERVMAAQARELAERQEQALELTRLKEDLELSQTGRDRAEEARDRQAAWIQDLQQRFDELHRDRSEAQLVMDAQAEQLKGWVDRSGAVAAEKDELKAKLSEQKRIMKIAKGACRNKGRCFQLPSNTEKERRSVPQKIVRELRRIPANLIGRRAVPSPATTPARKAPEETLPDRYSDWIAEHEPDAAGLEQQRAAATQMAHQTKISLLLPTLNTPASFLEELFESLAAQTYSNFEICIADGGSAAATTELIKQWQRKEARIHVLFLGRNLGIAENTNRALDMATGRFFACIDHDDLLPPFGLYELARAIAANPDADIFYSDEDRLTVDGKRHSPFFKPEWSPEYLLSSMYLGHLTAYRRTIVDRVGRFRSEFDLSQDYDFALRATEQARGIGHVPHVLYHWREHPASGSAGGKPDARKSNLAALADAMRRRGLAAEIVAYPTANRARLRIEPPPRVSIIVPTDSEERARACTEQLPSRTAYRDYEIVVVTNSRLVDLLQSTPSAERHVRFVRYDERFNFSAKCNLGARAATGARLIFYNDDVESTQADWIENLIEPLQNPEVGGVAPKLLYATGKIQHAGLVTGVRGLVGTACHQWPGDSPDYTNFAQSMRNVSALSGACLAMRRDDFFAVGEWDEVNTPIAHSDLDLCFKIREAGMRCVYTPFVTMTHRGHESIGAVQPEEQTVAREKASVFLLKRWPQYACHDPYYTDNVRDWLYADSPTPIRMFCPQEAAPVGEEGDLLFVSHDLSLSGAPLILWQVAKWCRDSGFFVVAMSPEDGPMREKFERAGIPLIVDPLVMKNHPSFVEFARQFDCVVASTIFGAPVVHAAKAGGIPHLWWIHEGRVAEEYVTAIAGIRSALPLADMIVTPDTRSAQIYQPFRKDRIRVLSYGIPDPRQDLPAVARSSNGPLKFLLLGSVEHRKGQLVLLEALKKLAPELAARALFQIVGRPHDPLIAEQLRAAARDRPYLTYREGVSHEEALGMIRDTDVMISCSADETGPIILIEALALGRPILSTNVGAVAEKLGAGGDGAVFVEAGDIDALAAAVTEFISEPERRQRLANEARGAFERHFTYDRFGEGFAALVREVILSGVESVQEHAEKHTAATA